MRGELDDVVRATDVVDGALALQLVGDGEDVDGLFLHVQGLDRLEDLLVARVVEGLGTDELRDDGEGVLVDHQGTEHHLLHVDGLRLQVTVGGVDGCGSLFATGRGIFLFWHML